MRRVALRKQKENQLYAFLRLNFLARHPKCWVYPNLRSSEPHHILGRGKYLNDTSTWMAVSRRAHRKIHDNPEWARSKGYLPQKPCHFTEQDYSGDGVNERHLDDIRKEIVV